MKIVSLQAENFKRLKAVQIDPAGNFIEISGENAQGKSSILDAIWAAIGGKAAAPVKPVRIGEEVAIIAVNLGELAVTRKFINKDDGTVTTSLTVTNEDGRRLSPPQDILNDLTEALTFDPLEFTRRKPKDQAHLLRKFVPGFDFEAAEAKLKELEDKRRDKNRDAKRERATADALPLPEDSPETEADTDTLLTELEEATTTNQANERLRLQRQGLTDEITAVRVRISQDQHRLAELEHRLAELHEPAEDVDVAAVRARYDEAMAQNAAFTAVEQKRAQEQLADKTEAEAKALTEEIAALRDATLKAVEAASLPVEGLTFDETGVSLRGIPFADASQAEQLETAIAVAVALDPKLRVVRVKDGALLGEAAMRKLAEFADAYDMQIWVETIESARPSAIQIVDGAISEEA
ncbi:MAG: AAA family ATPase [Roseibium sp.]|nr:AAA family ATPase [Roseibium sp.]